MACRCVALISGNGSNLQAIIHYLAQEKLPVEWIGVLSNQAQAYGLQRAQHAGIPTAVIERRAFQNRAAFDTALAQWLQQTQPDLIILAGFMHILSTELVMTYRHCLLNIHPSLLPDLRGLHTHQRAIAAGYTEHGASVHFVTPELDSGPVIIQAKVPILPEDTPDTLAARVLAQEHQIYPLAVRWFIEGRLELRNDQVFLDQQPLLQPVIFTPTRPTT